MSLGYQICYYLSEYLTYLTYIRVVLDRDSTRVSSGKVKLFSHFFAKLIFPKQCEIS